MEGWGPLSFLSLAPGTKCDSERLFSGHHSWTVGSAPVEPPEFSLVLRCFENYGQGTGLATRGRPGVCGLRMKGVLFLTVGFFTLLISLLLVVFLV